MKNLLKKLPSLNINPPKWLIFLSPLILSLSCLLAVCTFFFFELKELNTIEHYLLSMKNKIIQYQSSQEKENALIHQIESADPFYFNNHFEFSFLEDEIKTLEAFSLHLKLDREMQERLSFLKQQNQLILKEKRNRNNKKYKEVELYLDHPIEINAEDLILFLNQTEYNNCIKGAPQILFKSFDLKKKELSEQKEVFEIDFKMIKREKL